MAIFNFTPARQTPNNFTPAFIGPVQQPKPTVVAGPQSYYANVAGPMSTNRGIAGPNIQGQVQGPQSPSLPAVGSVGNSQPNAQPFQLSTPQQSSFDEQGYNHLFSSYDQAISDTTSQLQMAVDTLQGGLQSGIKAQEAYKQNANTELDASFRRESGRTESAVDEARRQQSEIGQGIQSLYGGTTGTGAFATEVLGAQTLKNIGNFRQQLTDYSYQIRDSREKVASQVQSNISKLEQDTKQLIAQSVAEYNSQANSLRMNKAMSKVQQQQQIGAARQEHESLVRQVQMQNEQYRQYYQAQQAQYSRQAQSQLDRINKEIQVAKDKELAFYSQNFRIGGLNEQGMSAYEKAAGYGGDLLQTPQAKQQQVPGDFDGDGFPDWLNGLDSE